MLNVFVLPSRAIEINPEGSDSTLLMTHTPSLYISHHSTSLAQACMPFLTSACYFYSLVLITGHGMNGMSYDIPFLECLIYFFSIAF